MASTGSIVVIGAGQAGASAAAKLRSLGYGGAIHLVGNEPHLPYQRPPLSKKYLTGEIDLERLLIKPEAFYESSNINLHLDVDVVGIDTNDNSISLADGKTIHWDQLLLATGSRPRALPTGMVSDGCPIHVLRNLHDVHSLTPALENANTALIVGGGYIGLETAASARKFDVNVTLVEATERILQRVAAEATSKRFAELHRNNGVDIREGTGLASITSLPDGKCRASFSNGDSLDVDLVLVGIGVVPNTELAEAAGFATQNGISVDNQCRTSNPKIYAAGDCASFNWRGTHLRLESVQNAIDQAEAAAANMMGEITEYDPMPWFWSDQYDVKLQIAGLSQGFNRTTERSGPRQGSGSIWYYRDDSLLAVDAFNDAAAYMTGKRLLEAGINPPFKTIANPDTALKSLLKQ